MLSCSHSCIKPTCRRNVTPGACHSTYGQIKLWNLRPLFSNVELLYLWYLFKGSNSRLLRKPWWRVYCSALFLYWSFVLQLYIAVRHIFLAFCAHNDVRIKPLIWLWSLIATLGQECALLNLLHKYIDLWYIYILFCEILNIDYNISISFANPEK